MKQSKYFGTLGNKRGVVKPWYLPFDFVFCRFISNKTMIIRNNTVKNISHLPVEVVNGKVIGIYDTQPTSN